MRVSTLNEDLWVNILSRLELGSFFNVSRACKQLFQLSHDRGILTPLYDTGHLSRAYGPASWHSTEDMRRILLRYNNLTTRFILSSEKPFQMTRYITHTFLNLCGQHLTLLCQELLFLLTEKKEILCFYFGDMNLLLWRYQFASDLFQPVLRCCEMIPTSTSDAGCWDINLIASLRREPIIFLLRAQKTNYGYQVSQIAVKRCPLLFSAGDPEVKNNWFVAGSVGGTSLLLNTRSSGSYVLAPKDETKFSARDVWDSRFYNDAQAFVVKLVADPNPNAEFVHMVVYEIPEEPPLFGGCRVIDWTHCVPIHKDWVVHSLFYAPQGRINNRDDGQSETTKQLHVVIETNDFESELAEISSISHPGPTVFINRRQPLLDRQLSMHQTRLYQVLSEKNYEHSTIVVEHVPIFDDLEDGGFHFGERETLTLPCELNKEFGTAEQPDVAFDELRGKIYVFKWVGNSCTIHVVG